MFKTIPIIVMAALCLNFNSRAQSQQTLPLPEKQAILGKVVSATTGEALPGAVIKIMTSNHTTVSNDRGEFILTLSNGTYNISISHLSYKSKNITIQIPLKKQLIITLETDDKNLKEVEVVSTGYQNIPKERSTGSFEQVENKLLNRKVSSDILSRLDGNSGVLFDKRSASGPKLQIRGLYTLTESIAQPLIILDNFPYQGDINSINPNDIENITLLKDASAASIWGAKAGNGVIVIKTKKGRPSQKPTVSFNANVNVANKPDLFDLPIIPTTNFIDIEAFLFKKGAYNSYISNTSSHPAITSVVEILNKREKGLIGKLDSARQVDALRGYDVRNDFEKYIYTTQVNEQYQADISGGTNASSYRVSAGYDNNKSNLVGNEYNRITFSSSYRLNLSKKTSIESTLQYSQSNLKNNSLGEFGSGAYNLRNSISATGAQSLPIYSRFKDENEAHLNIDKYRSSYLDTVGGGKLLNWRFSPLDELELNDKNVKTSALLINLGIKHQVLSFMSAELLYQYQQNNSSNRHMMNSKSYYVRDLTNQFTNLKATGSQLKYPVPLGGILDDTYSIDESHNFRSQLNVDQKWSQKHQINAILGAEIRESNGSSNSNRTYGYDQRLNVSNVDFVNSYPKILGSQALVPYNTGYTEMIDHFISFYANASYSYKERYTFSGSARNDATNLFGADTKNKWKPLWSAGASWNISREGFYRLGFLPYLKFRLTYGYQGNTNNLYSAYTRIAYLAASLNTLTNVPSAIVTSPGNPELRWESVRQINSAIDFATKGNKITGTLEYYLKKSTDVLANETIDPTTGYSTVLRNSANLRGDGLEVRLNSRNFSNNNFEWNTSANFSLVRYKVSKYHYNINTDGFVSDGGIIYPLEGYNPYAVVSYKWAGLDPVNGNPRGYQNGEISSDWNAITSSSPLADQVLSGSALPTIFGNLLNTFRYKSLSFSFNITYKLDYYFRRNTINYSALISEGYGHSEYMDRWQNPGDEKRTNIPSFIYPNPNSLRDSFYQNSEVNVEKGDNIKLQDFRISYDLINTNNQRKHAFNNFQIYAYASDLNLLIWRANSKGIDPDFPTGLKPGKSVAVGIRTTF